jgi:hypothetical protein
MKSKAVSPVLLSVIILALFVAPGEIGEMV